MAPFIGHALLVVFRLTGSKDKANKKTMPKEWTDALGFAIVAATIIRVFFFEAFHYPNRLDGKNDVNWRLSFCK